MPNDSGDTENHLKEKVAGKKKDPLIPVPMPLEALYPCPDIEARVSYQRARDAAIRSAYSRPENPGSKYVYHQHCYDSMIEGLQSRMDESSKIMRERERERELEHLNNVPQYRALVGEIVNRNKNDKERREGSDIGKHSRRVGSKKSAFLDVPKPSKSARSI